MIIVVWQIPNTGEYVTADPFEVISTFKYGDVKVRVRLTRNKPTDKFKLIAKIGNSRKVSYISNRILLQIIQGNYVTEDNNQYVLMSVLETFIDEYAKIYAARKFKTAYQLILPLYEEPEPEPDYRLLGIIPVDEVTYERGYD